MSTDLKPTTKQVSLESAVSTGSTLLNLACSDHPYHGYSKGGYYYLVGDSQSGKSQPLDCKVMTPSGWARMGDLYRGDCITDPDGGPDFQISGIFPQGKLEVFRITFSDGAVTEASADHLWLVQDANNIRHRTWKKLTTAQMAAYRYPLWIPTTSPVEFELQVNLTIPPYLLGVLLGNGLFGKRSVRISSTDDFLMGKIAAMLPKGVEVHHRNKGDYELCFRKGKKNPLLEAVRKLGLCGSRAHEKFIPDDYLFSSLKDRWELLQGMMDTDGYASKNNGVEYSSSSSRLAKDFQQLVRSLGGVATWRNPRKTNYTYKEKKKVGRKHYRMSIAIKNRPNVFTLPRKKKRVRADGRSRRRLVSVEHIGKKECQCISVNTKRHLYITDDYIVTHNTWLSLTCFSEACLNPAFEGYRLIFDDVEGGAMMNMEHYFGKEVANRMEAPRYDAKKRPIMSDTVESFYYNLFDTIDEGKPFIYVLDSQDALTSESSDKKFRKQKVASEEGKDAAGSYGDGKAKYHSEHLRLALAGIRKLQSILIIIGQTRDNIGFGFEKKTRAGGRSLRFYANLEIWTSVFGKLQRLVRGKKRTIGNKCIAEVKKNRVTGKIGKDRSVIVPIYYELGIDDIGSCVDYLVSEKHWSKKSGIIAATDVGITGKRGEVIAHIEERDMERRLRRITGEVWKRIEAECIVERKKRYL